MTDINIPPEALRAMMVKLPPFFSESMARAACIAMLRAWPGMRDTSTEGGEPHWQHHLILPLTQEKTNAEG